MQKLANKLILIIMIIKNYIRHYIDLNMTKREKGGKLQGN